MFISWRTLFIIFYIFILLLNNSLGAMKREIKTPSSTRRQQKSLAASATEEQRAKDSLLTKCPTPECPIGTIRRQKPLHTPRYNGCGAYGFTISTADDFTSCCNKHDICYDSCGNWQEKCDFEFKKCMESQCEMWHSEDAKKLKQCKSSANFMVMGTAVFGCGTFVDSQKDACECVPIEKEEL